jgi:hypothetical protein
MLEHDMISTLTAFVPPTGSQLFHAFGLPLILPDATRLLSTSHHTWAIVLSELAGLSLAPGARDQSD